MDVNRLQSQSLVTMSAKHYTWLFRSAGRLGLSAQTARQLDSLQSWTRLSPVSPKHSPNKFASGCKRSSKTYPWLLASAQTSSLVHKTSTPEDELGMLNINSRAVPTTAVYNVNKSLHFALAETLRLAFLSPLHKQGYCSRTEISSSWSLTQAAHKTMKGTVLQVALHSGLLVPRAGLRHPAKKRQDFET